MHGDYGGSTRHVPAKRRDHSGREYLREDRLACQFTGDDVSGVYRLLIDSFLEDYAESLEEEASETACEDSERVAHWKRLLLGQLGASQKLMLYFKRSWWQDCHSAGTRTDTKLMPLQPSETCKLEGGNEFPTGDRRCALH